MNILHALLTFFCPFIFGLSIEAGGTGQGAGTGGGGEGGGGAAAGAGGAGQGGAADAGGAGAGSGAFDIRQHTDDAGGFKPGWSKAAGVPDTLESKFTRPEALARSYVALEKQIGAKGVIIPGPNATPAERDAFYNALGRPAKPEEYGFTKPDKIGDRAVPDTAWDAKRAGTWQQKLFEMGVPKDTAQKIMQAAVEESMTGLGMIEEARQAMVKQGTDALKKEWGADFDTNLAAAKRAADEFGGKELIDHPGLANDPIMIRALAKIGAKMTEAPGKGIRQQGGEQRLTAADARVEAQKITADIANRSKADRSFKNTPEYAQLAARKTELFKLAYPEA